MPRRWPALCGLLLLSAAAEAAPQSAPESVERKVDAVFSAYDRKDSPGCALGVVRDGRLAYSRGYGMANLEHGIPITAKTVFDLGSTSKQFTAASILLLAQQGKLSLDDDARRFIPELPDYGQPIRIRHLLHHTSGLRDYLTLMSLAGVDFDGVTNEDDALRILLRQKALNFTPGAEHLYSNSGYFLLSLIVKRASGKSLRQFAAENIFGPLAMNQTQFNDDHTRIIPGRATAYAPAPGGGFGIAMSGFEQTGDGAVLSSVEELLRWDGNFYEPKVGGEELLRELTRPGTLAGGEALRYASGLRVEDYRGRKAVSHGGSWAGYRAEMLRFPEERFSVVCLCNRADANPSRLARQVADIYLADKFSAAAPVAPRPPSAGGERDPAAGRDSAPGPLSEYAGTYYSEELDVSYRLDAQEGKLVFRMGSGTARPLLPDSRDVFRSLNRWQFEFRRDAQGRVAGFAIGAGRVRNIGFVLK